MPFVFDNPNHHGSGFYFDDPSETFSGSGGGGDNGGGGGGGGGGGQIPVYDDNTVNTLNLELELDL